MLKKQSLKLLSFGFILDNLLARVKNVSKYKARVTVKFFCMDNLF